MNYILPLLLPLIVAARDTAAHTDLPLADCERARTGVARASSTLALSCYLDCFPDSSKPALAWFQQHL